MFDEVYKIAKESKSLKELQIKLKKLDINAKKGVDPVYITAGAKLAIEGLDDKVEWMRLSGANVDEIASGYALAGNSEQLKIYHTQHGASIDYIAYFYALAGYHKEVERYRVEHNADVNWIASGYAQAGAFGSALVYHRKYHANIDCIAYYCALLGADENVKICQLQYDAHVNFIAQGYAEAGDHEKVETYHLVYLADVNEIATSYARAGYHKEVENYRILYNANVDEIAHSYALSGHHEQVEMYRTQHKANITKIAEGYALAGNHAKQKKYDIHYILDCYQQERASVTDASGRTKEYFHGRFFSIFQKSATQKREAIHALKSALDGEDVDLSKHLSTLRNGKLGKELRTFVKSGIGNGLAEEKVTTVRGFVKALQKKNSTHLRPNSCVPTVLPA